MAKRKTIKEIPIPKPYISPAKIDSPWFVLVVLLVVGFAAYSNALRSSFHFDDETSIVNNPAIRNLEDLYSIWKYSPLRFVTYLSFALNFRLNGLDAFGFHLLNILIHVASALVVCFIIRRLHYLAHGGHGEAPNLGPPAALLAALIFLAHPIQTQAVTYVAQRAVLLAAFFFLLSLFLYCAARTGQLHKGEGKHSVELFYIGSAFAGILALFSKETAFTLPFAVILFELFFFRSVALPRLKYIAVLILLILGVPIFLILAGFLEPAVEGAIPTKAYLLTQPAVIATYLRLSLAPIGLNLDYDFSLSKSLLDTSFLTNAAVLAFVVFLGIRLFSRHRLLSFGIFWFFLTLLPESSVVALPDVINEHRMYLPNVGVSLVFAFGITYLTKRWNRAAFLVLSMAVVFALAWGSYSRNKVWKNELTLWNDVVSKSPGKARPYNNRGKAYLELGMYDNALRDFERALILDPFLGDAYSNRGTVYLFKKEYDRAIADNKRALEIGVSYASNYPKVVYNLGLAYSNRGDQKTAIEHYTEAIRAYSEEPTFYYNRAIARERVGEIVASIADYNQAISLNPSYSKAINNRGVLYQKLGKLDSALADFAKAQVCDPSFVPPYINSARILVPRFEYARALELLTIALGIEPNNVDMLLLRGQVFLKARAYDKALSDFDAAIRLDAWKGENYFRRGETLRSMGREVDAIKEFRRAEALGFRNAR